MPSTQSSRLPLLLAPLLFRWLRRLGLAVLVLLTLWFAGTEWQYRELLEYTSPPPNSPSRAYPAQLRQTCWSALGESGSPRMQPWAMGLLPFQLGWAATKSTISGARYVPQPPGLRTADQLTRNWNLGHGFLRRFAYMVWVTRHWSAEQALDGVLDQAWFGVPETYGAASSSLALFGQPVDSLDDRQVAILGVLLQRPDLLCNPRQEPPEKWESRIRRHLHPNSERRTELDDAAVIGLMDSLPVCKERSRKQPTEESSIEAK